MPGAILPRVNCRYGAPMGRPGAHPGDNPHCVMSVRRVPIDGGGYDSGGAYWGLGAPLWQAHGLDQCDGAADEITDYRRAPSKAAAIAAWAAEWPAARFN
jgi:hypothetical protein